MPHTTSNPRNQLIGVIADTHGLLRPEATANLDGVSLIIHAGDVGSPEVLEALRTLAPVVVVRGNVDHGPWAEALPAFELVDTAAGLIYVRHILEDVDIDPAAAGVRIVITGHTHNPDLREHDGVIYLNPGSAGPRRFNLPITMCWLEIRNGEITIRHLPLPV